MPSLRFSSLLRWPMAALFSISASCTETDYELFKVDGTGGVVIGGEGGGTGGDVLAGGGAPPLCVDADGAIAQRVEIRNVLSGHCLGQGAPAVQVQDPAFEMVLGSCADEDKQIFEVIAKDSSSYELRNLATDYDVDVRWASTDDGTTLVLHAPTGNFNQLFFFLPLGTTGQVQLAPRHALGDKCFALRSGRLELWPCDPNAADQAFELLACSSGS